MKLILTLGVCAVAIAAQAATTVPANTGHFDGLGNDLNWSVSKNGGAATTIGAASFGGYYNGSPFTAASAWIGENANAYDTYVFTTTFNIDAADLAGYGLSIVYSSDNASRILLNGIDKGGAAYGGPVPGNSYLQSFTQVLSSGFVSGLNTLSFSVTNDAGSTSDPSHYANPDPIAMRAEIQAVPEPASMAALGLGIAGLLRRRRKD